MMDVSKKKKIFQVDCLQRREIIGCSAESADVVWVRRPSLHALQCAEYHLWTGQLEAHGESPN